MWDSFGSVTGGGRGRLREGRPGVRRGEGGAARAALRGRLGWAVDWLGAGWTAGYRFWRIVLHSGHGKSFLHSQCS